MPCPRPLLLLLLVLVTVHAYAAVPQPCKFSIAIISRPPQIVPGEMAVLRLAPMTPPEVDCVAQISSDPYLDISPAVTYFPAGSTAAVSIELTAKYPNAGHVKLHGEDGILLADVQVSVIRSRWLGGLCVVIGWLYFAAWSISFYPQAYENYKLQSVEGLSFDFLYLNIAGWICYTAYNFGLYCFPFVQDEYSQAHPGSELPVLTNDVFFAGHALLMTCFTIVQTFIYESGDQKVSQPVRVKLVLVGVLVLILLAYTVFGPMTALTFLTLLSIIKLGITTIKYIPQALLNYRRQSTVGWSIGNIILDFTGGLLSILQMILIAWNMNDWSAFIGNPTKFFLGLVSIMFDVLFLVQHYMLYPNRQKSKKTDVTTPLLQ